MESVLVKRIEVRDLVQHGGMSRVVFGKERIEAAAVAEHPQRFLRLPRRRGQHQHQDAKVLLHVARRELLRALEDQRSRAGRVVERLPIRMIAILQRRERLVVNLRRRYNPQHQPAIALAEARVHQVDRLRREQCLPAAGRNLQAERRQRAQPVAAWIVDAALHLLPSLLWPIDPKLRINRPSLRVLRAQLGERFEIHPHRPQRLLLVFLELDHLPCALW